MTNTLRKPRTSRARANEEWSEQDLTTLRRLNDERASVLDIAHALERPVHQVRAQRLQLGLRARMDEWSAQQHRTLAVLLKAGVSLAGIAKKLGKSSEVVARRMEKRRWRSLRFWLPSEVEKLRSLIQEGYYIDEIARRLGRSEKQIGAICRSKDLQVLHKLARKKGAWSKSEDQKLVQNIKKGMSPGEAARVIGRSIGSLRLRLRALGLADRHGAKLWSPEEDARLEQLVRERRSVNDISAELGRSKQSITLRRLSLGLPRWQELREPSIPVEEVIKVANKLWSEGHIPTKDGLAKHFHVHRRRVVRGINEWRKTKSQEELRDGPNPVSTIDALKPFLPNALRHAPFTCLDPLNDGRWKTPDPKLIRYLAKIPNSSVRNTLALHVLITTNRSAHGIYTRVTIFNNLWTTIIKSRPGIDVLTLDPNEVLFELRADLSIPLKGHYRDQLLASWISISNSQEEYLHQVGTKAGRFLKEFCLPLITDRRKLLAARHWKTANEAQQERVKKLTDQVHRHYHRIRFAANVRMNAMRRMHEATLAAIDTVRRDRPSLPYAYSYDETLIDIDGKSYEQTIEMEIWEFRDAAGEALKHGYKLANYRAIDFEERRPPFDIPYYVPRYVRTIGKNQGPHREPWVLEMVKFNIFTNGKSAAPGVQRREQFNKRWGYRPGRTWGSKSTLVNWPKQLARTIRYLNDHGFAFIRVEGFYQIALYANLSIRTQTLAGARIGEVQQIAATPECVKKLVNVGPARATRWLFFLMPKGHGQPRPFYIEEDTATVLALLVGELRRIHGTKKLPVVKAQYSKCPPDRYVMQANHKMLHQDSINIMQRVLLHGVLIDPDTGKVVELRSHALRHAFATELSAIDTNPDVIRQLLNQKNLKVTAYYSRPTMDMVRAAADVLFVQRIDLARAAVRSPKAVRQMLLDAEGKIGALTEVLGGTCVVAGLCPAKFSCLGCAGNAPDPAKRKQVEGKRDWAVKQRGWAKEQRLPAEERQLEQIVNDCETMLAEMRLLEVSRADAHQVSDTFSAADASQLGAAARAAETLLKRDGLDKKE